MSPVARYRRQSRPGENRSRLWGAGWRGSTGLVIEARARSSGEIPGKVFAGVPWKGQSPWEQPAAGALTLPPVARDSRKGQSPGTAARRAGRRFGGGVTAGGTVGGCFRAETSRIPCERGKLRRENPKSAAGVK
jgi:hypothetical protein